MFITYITLKLLQADIIILLVKILVNSSYVKEGCYTNTACKRKGGLVLWMANE